MQNSYAFASEVKTINEIFNSKNTFDDEKIGQFEPGHLSMFKYGETLKSHSSTRYTDIEHIEDITFSAT